MKSDALKIVVVEDDPTFLTFWGRLLKELKVTKCRFFADPVEASLVISEEPCDILISDVVMPGLNGYELARIARRKDPDCKVVLTTAYSTDLTRFALDADSHFHLLHKPYTDLTALKIFLKHILDGDISFDDISENSSSENEDYPQVTEWKL